MKLGTLLVQAQVVTEAQLQGALREQEQWGGRLGEVLVRMGVLDEATLVRALSHQLGIPVADFARAYLPPALVQRIDRATCEQLCAVPVRFVAERGVLQVAVSDPHDAASLAEIASRIGIVTEPVLAGATQIRAAIAALYLNVERAASAARLPVAAAAPAKSPATKPGPPSEAQLALQRQAEQQARAIRALTSLLLEKGVISPADLDAG